MRPCSVYANLAWAAGCPCDILRSLYGPHRVGVRLVMFLLSARGQTAGAIAEVLGCDASTVRRWIHRTTSTASPDCVTSLGLAVHAWAAHGAPSASCGWWPSPRSGRSLGSTSGLAARP